MVSVFSGSLVLAEYDNGAVPGAHSISGGGATTFYHQDHLSVRLTTDGSGNVLSQEGHLPYGEPWYQSGTGNRWLFTSYNRDSESGLAYALARYYDSRAGTFCSADPLAGNPSDPQSWNRYPYGRNDPITITDPSGKIWTSFIEGLIDVGIIIASQGTAAPFMAAMNAMGADMPRTPFSSTTPMGASDHSISYPGLDASIHGALGIPTIADLGGPISGFTNAKPVYCLPTVMSAMQLAYNMANIGNLAHGGGSAALRTEAGFPMYRTPDGGAIVGNDKADAPLNKAIQYGPANGFGVQARNNATDVFHTHPAGDPGMPSYPGNTAGETPDTASAVSEGKNIYVISRNGLSVAPATGPIKPPKRGWNPWIVQRNGIDDWMKKLKTNCAQ